MIRTIVLFTVLFVLSGCQTLGPTEHAVRFRKLPPQLLGGVSQEVIPPGKTVIVVPAIDELYRFTTAVQDVGWGSFNKKGEREELLYTRARDGNEVALAVTIQFQIRSEDESLTKLVHDIARNNQEVRSIVSSVARADIRTYMNELRTSEFLDKEARYRAIDAIQVSMQKRLSSFGIDIVRVNLDDFRFERLREVDESGTTVIDTSYQDKLREVQRLREDTEREQERIKSVEAKKAQELNDMRAKVNREIQEAQGYKNQAIIRGDGYLESKRNEGQGILVQGKAQADGLKEQLAALASPGGMNILRLELAKSLALMKGKFVVLGDSQRLDVQKTDTNELLKTLGIMEGMKDPKETPKPQP